MPAIVKIGYHEYFFTSINQASKAVELLGKATPVKGHHTDGKEVYRAIDDEDVGFRCGREISMTITQQKKPLPAQLALPGE